MTQPSKSIHANLTFKGPGEQLEKLRTLINEIGSRFPGVTVTGSLDIKLTHREILGTTSIILGSPIEDLISLDEAFGQRAIMCLRRIRIETVGELIEKSEDDLLAITNFGHRSLELVKERLAEHGFSLREGI